MDIEWIINEINNLKNKSAEELAQQYLSEQARAETDFPFLLERVAALEISETVTQALTGPGHYLAVYTAAETESTALELDGRTFGTFDTRSNYKEIDLFYKPADGAAQKVFGLGSHVTPTASGISITPSSSGAAACLIFNLSLNPAVETIGLDTEEQAQENDEEV